MEEFTSDMGKFWRHITSDTQLRWIGPEKGAIHLATGAVVNAVWDLWGKHIGKPVWRIVADMSPEEIVRLLDFRYVTDALTPEEALEMLRARQEGKADRIREMQERGFPAYITSAGWLGLDDDTVRRKVQEAVDAGLTHIKIKVGADRESDVRRLRIVREVLGEDRTLMVDANQVWEVPEAIEWMRELAPFRPWWIEEPTSPDDILGHKAVRDAMKPLGIGVATGEMCQNRVIFKQLMQAEAIDFCQIDSTRLAGVNEVIIVLLLAAKFNVPVCPHAGGVGLCEYVNHLAMIDYVCVSGSLENRVLEYVDHLHEHFVDPVVIRDGRYTAPSAPGYSITMHAATLRDYAYPEGRVWVEELRRRAEVDGAPEPL